jgi:GNAT superfamily N-acetyltransferase
LVSVCDGGEKPSILTILCDGEPLGALSFIITENPHRPGRRKCYGRIDLVIVDPNARGLGLGRVLIVTALSHMLLENGPELYSISCLAAHRAVAKVLREVGFDGAQRKERNFLLMQVAVDSESVDQLDARIAEATADALRKAAYRIRQQMGPASIAATADSAGAKTGKTERGDD